VISTTTATPIAAPGPLRSAYNQAAGWLERLPAASLLLLAARLAMAAVFFMSGRTKVEGWFTVSDSALFLFREEYRLPLLDPSVAAHLAVVAEHLFPLMLVMGLGTRVAALALAGMTLVIQMFVYPAAWPTHLTWLVALVLLALQGGGRWSLDRPLGLK
jgi:putative oxidoreductase